MAVVRKLEPVHAIERRTDVTHRVVISVLRPVSFGMAFGQEIAKIVVTHRAILSCTPW